jgi:hypothetical protein
MFGLIPAPSTIPRQQAFAQTPRGCTVLGRADPSSPPAHINSSICMRPRKTVSRRATARRPLGGSRRRRESRWRTPWRRATERGGGGPRGRVVRNDMGCEEGGFPRHAQRCAQEREREDSRRRGEDGECSDRGCDDLCRSASPIGSPSSPLLRRRRTARTKQETMKATSTAPRKRKASRSAGSQPH